MQQASQSLNPWLLSYVEQHRNKQSRYQIDKYLIDAGYDVSEIELAWQFLTQIKVVDTPIKRFSLRQIILFVILIGLSLFPLNMAFQEKARWIFQLCLGLILLINLILNLTGLSKRIPKFVDSFIIAFLIVTILYGGFNLLWQPPNF